jgi:transposase
LCSNRAATRLAYLSLSWSEWDYPLPVVYLPPILLVQPTDEPRRAEHRNVDREVSHCRLQVSSAASVDLAYLAQGYTGERPAEEAQAHAISLEVVKHSESKRGFVLLPRRWVMARTFSWIEQNRRLSKDYERLCASGEAFVYAAMTRLMVRRLTRLCGLFIPPLHALG